MQLTATKLEASSEVEGDVSPRSLLEEEFDSVQYFDPAKIHHTLGERITDWDKRRAAVLNSVDNTDINSMASTPWQTAHSDGLGRPFFTDMKFELLLDSYENYNMVVHGWYDMIYEKKSWVGLNTGRFVIRNCQWSLDLANGVWIFWTPGLLTGLSESRGRPQGSSLAWELGRLRCAKQMERAYNFADNQVLEAYGYVHPNLQMVSVEKVEKVEVEREAIGMRHTNLRGGSH
ncbi:hypothetical protein R1sor_020081 [Riccia sorocarpa]|uniref:Uncharacterized protein n=1 Tax=Riccia sorocarpa TaxID=122646 RepID=A0ABD3IHN8_9MARC